MAAAASPATVEDRARPAAPLAEPWRATETATRVVGQLRDVEIAARDGGFDCVLRGDGLNRPSILYLESPPRVVLDLEGVVAAPRRIAGPASGPVRAVRVARFKNDPRPVTRVVFDLAAPAVAEIEGEGAAVHVVLRPRVRP
jgi:hypothetical protein